MMKSILLFLTLLAIASATFVKLEKSEDSKDRTIVTTSSGTFLTTNSTLLILGVFLLIVLAAVGLYVSGGFSADSIHQKYSQQYEDTLSVYSDYTNNRFRRFASKGNEISSIYILVIRCTKYHS